MESYDYDVIRDIVDQIKTKISSLDDDLEILSGDEYRIAKDYKSFIVDILENLKNIDTEDDRASGGEDEQESGDCDDKESSVEESDIDNDDYE